MFYFFLAFVLSLIFTLFAKRLALYHNIVDTPDAERKRHARPTPLLGGTALFFAFWLAIFAVLYFADIRWKSVYTDKLVGVLLGSAMLVVMGWVDDVKKLLPWPRFLITAGAALAAVVGGVSLSGITNPFGGILDLNFGVLILPWIGTVSVAGGLVVFLWLLGMMYTTKILDGLDGLSTGVTAVGALVIYLLSSTKKFYQADTRVLALVLLGVCLGFLIFNFHPAKIFLGEGGSLFLGYILGVLAVIAGGKLATALLVMAVPILDLARVIWVRLARHQPVYQGDREHLHFKLLDMVGHRNTVLILYAVALVFGVTTLFLRSAMKLLVIAILVVVMVGAEMGLMKRVAKNEQVG